MKKIYEYVVLFAIIALSPDTLLGGVVIGVYRSTLILCIICLPMYLEVIKRKNISKDILIAIILISLIMLSMLINRDFVGYHFYILFSIINGYIYSKEFLIKEMKNKYINIMLFLCVYSLITTYIIKYIIPGVPTIINTANVVFYNYIFSYAIPTANYIRNFGIFREPGVFQMFISLALLFEFNKTNISKKNILIFTLTMISTFSTVRIYKSYYNIFNSAFKLKEAISKKQ